MDNEADLVITEKPKLRSPHMVCGISSWLDGMPVPRELREKVENRLTGCDVCRKACPKNQGLALRRH